MSNGPDLHSADKAQEWRRGVECSVGGGRLCPDSLCLVHFVVADGVSELVDESAQYCGRRFAFWRTVHALGFLGGDQSRHGVAQ